MNVTNRKRNKKKIKEIKSTAGQCETSSTSNEQGESSGTSSLGFSFIHSIPRSCKPLLACISRGLQFF